MRAKGYICHFHKKTEGKLIGITCRYRDYSLSCGTNDFMQVAEKYLEQLGSRKREFHSITCAGTKIIIE